MTRLDRYVATYQPDELITCCYLLIDPDAGTLTYANAGHLPPLIVSGRGGRWLDPDSDAPLGATPATPHGQTVTDLDDLDADGVLLIYTDGLVERRHAQLDDGLDLLADAACVLPGTADLQAAVETLVDALHHPDRTGDDQALLALRRNRPAPGDSRPG